VAEVYTKKQREEFIDDLLKTTGVDHRKKEPKPISIACDELILQEGTSQKDVKGTDARPATARTRLIPGTFRMRIENARLNAIYSELKHLNINNHPNAVAVLFRVFIEGFADVYMKTAKLKLSTKKEKTLKKKLGLIVKDMKQKNLLDNQTAQPVSRLTGKNSIGSIAEFNSYVHNMYYQPIADELKRTWDDISPFIKAFGGKV